MKKFLRQAFTGPDNRSIDIARVVGFEVIHFYIAISIYAIHKGGTFDPLTWGAGAASIMASIGAWIGLKAGSEPQPTSIAVTTRDGVSFSQKIGRQSGSDDDMTPSSTSAGMPQPPASLPGDDDK